MLTRTSVISYRVLDRDYIRGLKHQQMGAPAPDPADDDIDFAGLDELYGQNTHQE